MPVGEQGPGTAEQQVRIEIGIDKTLRAIAGVLGAEYESRAAGGGGAGGKWVFTSVDQLDSLIKKWTAVRDAIDDRRKRIEDARNRVYPPANDIMSQLQAKALKTSLSTMSQHADSMFRYATAYVRKLEIARSTYRDSEHRNTARMNETDRD
ncbi:hypothetical protein LWC34_36940 [Kibdelosporangium philippinense]|uniref:Uncharacterized protein n=1 Tax=Kibdelosporangium philippinense TaxID=211113 RepID=A0ABS8ZKN5_9PSEU|nr:hypothetical protein [Kibdelosporangium philippinense]MCE7008359.1 hypothetical protein [Kibdelosporangium philippinense]